MNKIVIDRNNLSGYNDNNISTLDNKIIFKKSGNYTLEYVNSDLIKLDMILLDNININLFIWSNDNNINIDNHYSLGINSNLNLFKFYYNELVKEKEIIDLNGDNATINYNFSSISKKREEYHIIVNHNNHRVKSKISNKCIGLNNSKITLRVDSNLDKGNLDCVMDQNSRILTLGDVEATIVPNMFIEEDSVEARHGSVVGRVSEEDIFYLMSRGITEEEAITLLIKGFIFSNLDVDMDKRGRIFQVIQNLRR